MNKVLKVISILIVLAIFLGNSSFNAVEAYSNSKPTKRFRLILEIGKNANVDSLINKFKQENRNTSVDVIDELDDDMRVIQVSGDKDLELILSSFESDENVESVQPDFVVNCVDSFSSSPPTDDYFINQWGLHNSEFDGIDINILPAWNITKGNNEVVVGVLDTGIDINHEDLKNCIFTNKGEIQDNNVDDDCNGYIDDCHGWDFFNNDNTVFHSFPEDVHGTFLAGIIAASSGNDIGMCGVSPNVKIMPLKFISGANGHTSDAIKAIKYAETMGVDIINCSWGGTEYNKVLEKVMKKSKILFVCSSGNEGYNIKVTPVYPTCFNCKNIISVGAINNVGQFEMYSNYGKEVDVAAPGTNILSTIPGNGYTFGTGTSFAAPFVTGIAALVKSRDCSIDFKGIRKLITKNVVIDKTYINKVNTCGRVDAFKILSDMKMKNK